MAINTLMNPCNQQEDPQRGQIEGSGISDKDVKKHTYSCKRCRRLKKKCTRTLPVCMNCHKANEACVYVPRSQRRKKLEVLRAFNELRKRSVDNSKSIDVSNGIDQQFIPVQKPSVEGPRYSYVYPDIRIPLAIPDQHFQEPSIRLNSEDRGLPPISSLHRTEAQGLPHQVPHRPYLLNGPQNAQQQHAYNGAIDMTNFPQHLQPYFAQNQASVQQHLLLYPPNQHQPQRHP